MYRSQSFGGKSQLELAENSQNDYGSRKLNVGINTGIPFEPFWHLLTHHFLQIVFNFLCVQVGRFLLAGSHHSHCQRRRGHVSQAESKTVPAKPMRRCAIRSPARESYQLIVVVSIALINTEAGRYYYIRTRIYYQYPPHISNQHSIFITKR